MKDIHYENWIKLSQNNLNYLSCLRCKFGDSHYTNNIECCRFNNLPDFEVRDNGLHREQTAYKLNQNFDCKYYEDMPKQSIWKRIKELIKKLF